MQQTFTSAILAFACLYLFSSSTMAQPTMDGTLNDAAWGTAAAIQNANLRPGGGTGPGFGANHEINALYVVGDATNIYFGIAGSVINGNRILLFIDSKTGGYSNGNFGRFDAPQGVDDFNSGTTFDAGFLPDYCLVIGTTAFETNHFVDLYTLSGSAGSGGGPNNFIGDAADADVGANPASDNDTRGFEVRISKTDLGYTEGDDIRVMAMYISDGGFLSNQFLSAAGNGEGDYGGNAVTFGSATPGFLTISATTLPVTWTSFDGQLIDGKTFLSWSTANEIDNDKFVVERSRDAQTWVALGEISGEGTTNQRSTYEYTDVKPLFGKNLYRIRQVNMDGTSDFSNIIELFNAKQEAFSLEMYPNPAQSFLSIRALSEITGDATISLQNTKSQQVLQRKIGAEALMSGYTLPVGNLPSGLYRVVLSYEGRQVVEQVSVVR
ncbi:MAG: T9SS type A sorting domain-containing protein [Bacteroidota bacterium]